MKLPAATLLFAGQTIIFSLTACSTVRLTPSAAEAIKNDGTSATLATEAHALALKLNAENSRMTTVGPEFAKKLIPSLLNQKELASIMGKAGYSTQSILSAQTAFNSKDENLLSEAFGLGNPSNPNFHWEQADRLAESIQEFRDETGRATLPDPMSLYSSTINAQALQHQLKAKSRDIRQLRRIEKGTYEYFVEGSLYFSIEPVIAIEPGIKTTAIPSIGVNWRPIPAGNPLSAIAIQGVLGGALNPSNEGNDTTGAIGVGLSYPIAGSGTISVGYIEWGTDEGSEESMYISLTLGNFAQKLKGN